MNAAIKQQGFMSQAVLLPEALLASHPCTVGSLFSNAQERY